MKATILAFCLACLSISTSLAQEKLKAFPTGKGAWLIESNTGLGNIHPANTGLLLRVSNGQTSWNIGGEAGYFIMPRLAVKLGLGYGNLATGPTSTSFGEGGNEGGNEGSGGEGGNEGGSEGGGEGGEGGGGAVRGTGGAAIAGLGSILSYKVGLKYYLQDVFPVQVDFSGTNVTNYNHELGIQAGYAIYLGENKLVSVEPGVRYSIPLTQTAGTIDNQFQLSLGFVLHLSNSK